MNYCVNCGEPLERSEGTPILLDCLVDSGYVVCDDPVCAKVVFAQISYGDQSSFRYPLTL